jgi:elongation factor Ts
MAKISMDLVKELREKTHVGLMDCKKALEEANGDIEKAIEILRKKGTAVASKRAENMTNNGRIESYISQDYKSGALVEVACETDFAAKTPAMEDFAKSAAQTAITSNIDNTETILSQKSPTNPKLTLNDQLNDLIAKIAEKIKINRIALAQTTGNGLVNSYIHPGSTVGVIVQLGADKDISQAQEILKTLAKDICMQITVTKPIAISPDKINPETIQKEREIAKEQLKDSNKPPQVIDKIIEGKLNKFYEEVCLVKQPFIKNDKITVEQYIKEVSAKTGVTITIAYFARFGIGR